jgi:hypothetical protein
MIVFNLTCGNEHAFEGWFASTAEFEQQQQSTILVCPVCGNNRISKALHAPYVNTGAALAPAQHERTGAPPQYANVGDELAKLVEHIIAETDDVGDAFPEEARKIHYEEAPTRKIRGNASKEEVRELRDEGIEVIALPIPDYRLGKTH